MVSKMAKIIKTSHAKKDHPIYTGRWVFSPSASSYKRSEKKKTKQRKGPPKGDPNLYREKT